MNGQDDPTPSRSTAPQSLPPSLIAILGERAIRRAGLEDLLEWAVQQLVEGYDSPALRGLAACSPPLHWSEVDQALAAVFHELGTEPPTPEESMWRYARLLAEQLVTGNVELAPALDRFRELWAGLDHPGELQNLAYLCYSREDLETETQTFYCPEATRENLADRVRMEAQQLLDATLPPDSA